jgi:hypothetical protein
LASIASRRSGAIVVAMFVSTPRLASIATPRAAATQPIRYLRPTSRRAKARSAPTAASTATQREMTYSIVLGARKNLVPGTIAYTSR